MDPIFMNTLGVLGQVVVVATVIERSLAFVFEHDWFTSPDFSPTGN